MKKIKVLEKEIFLYSQKEEDYICITDIAKYKNSEMAELIISHWLSSRFTVEFMGFWEKFIILILMLPNSVTLKIKAVQMALCLGLAQK